MKRAGLLLLVLVALIVGIDGILSLVRQRNVYVSIHATGVIAPQTLQATQPATPDASATKVATLAATTAATSGDLIITPAGTIITDVTWDYRVGPVFPKTIVEAAVYDSTNHIIATRQYLIDCNGASLQCDGNHTLTLIYGLKDQGDQTVQSDPITPWPLDTYTLQVTRTFAGFAPLKIATQTFHVVQ